MACWALGVTIKMACGATLHANAHIFCRQTPHDCSIIIFAVHFSFHGHRDTITLKVQKCRTTERLLKCSLSNDKKKTWGWAHVMSFSYSSVYTASNIHILYYIIFTEFIQKWKCLLHLLTYIHIVFLLWKISSK